MKRYLFLAFLLILAIALIGVAPLLAGNRTAGYTCPANTTCHILLEEGSETYLLTANGHAVIVVNGADSLLLKNEK